MPKRLTGWEYVRQKEKEHEEKVRIASGRPILKEQEVVGRVEIPVSDMDRRSTVGKIAHLAEDYGWEVRIGSATYLTRERMLEGKVVGHDPEEHRWVNAISPDGRHHLSVSPIIKLIDGWSVSDINEVKIHIAEFGKQDEHN